MKIIVAVKDLAVEQFGQPFTLRHTNEAMRSFRDEVQNPESPIAKHPSDYELWQVGEYNEDTGMINSKMERIARAIDLAMVKSEDINAG